MVEFTEEEELLEMEKLREKRIDNMIRHLRRRKVEEDIIKRRKADN